ncbi:ribosome production factor 2 homolog [Galendromus occidentalis]|uniref:Ribosome production factor 2 homolog n=1 Tax=Galendromus occidentalis TaxID=34638 RepID=A0AAJ7L613_9ACAR|nr:ribosome production factor 2 homolog [Galendromus occidentalis]
MTAVARVDRPKTRKGSRIVKAREPLTIENPKKTSFVKAANINQRTAQILKDLYTLKKTESVFYQKKNDIRPFEDVSHLEKLMAKKDTSLFAFGSHNKKRPQNIVLGRTFDRMVSDQFEFGVENYKALDEFKVAKIGIMVKPVLIFAGEAWQQTNEMKRLKNFLIDFFRGEPREYLGVSGLEHAISFTAMGSSTILLRSYKIHLKRSGQKTPRAEVEEIGPRMDLKLRRHKIASDDLFKQALRQPKGLKVKKKKNLEQDDLGTSLGRVHMERQDFGRLQTRKMKGLKKKKGQAASGGGEESGGDAAEAEPMEADEV